MKRYWVMLWSLWAMRLVRQPTVAVRVAGGWLRGQVARDGSHVRYTGIPYATYENRFQVFGGNPNHITLFGESAGSASVLHHFVSPMSKGMFQKAIMQSGSAISPWSLQFEPIKTAKLLANQMGYNLDDPYKLYELFKNKSITELLSTRVPRNYGDVVLSENIFVPCIEKNIPEADKFMPDSPYNLITKGTYNKVPVIIGHNNAEGYMFVGKENDTTIRNFNIFSSLPRDLKFASNLEKKQTADELRKLYFDEDDKDNDILAKLSKYEGDSGIVYPVTITAELLSTTMDYPVYMYKFCRDGWMNLLKLLFKFGEYPGATHADDLFYIFKFAVTLPQSFYEMKTIDRMSTMWTNFAKYGQPTPNITQLLPMKWYPLDMKEPQLLVIDKELSIEPLWNPSLRFWNETYTKYRRKS
ncbi:jg27529 [Pararge aegeria aegeria]|uniref:Carboxylic ester hydrolase n=1 Tax=Pararge aegeria aegeria TaxID=348720 RepID=A0A8S4SNR5_9NEOP|nr:jg27529 [Pararge aegeria aegeria]